MDEEASCAAHGKKLQIPCVRHLDRGDRVLSGLGGLWGVVEKRPREGFRRFRLLSIGVIREGRWSLKFSFSFLIFHFRGTVYKKSNNKGGVNYSKILSKSAHETDNFAQNQTETEGTGYSDSTWGKSILKELPPRTNKGEHSKNGTRWTTKTKGRRNSTYRAKKQPTKTSPWAPLGKQRGAARENVLTNCSTNEIKREGKVDQDQAPKKNTPLHP